jgi:predicted DNA-binding protein with PD1-like motif
MLGCQTSFDLLVRLFKGEELVSSIQNLAAERKIEHAAVQGIGAVEDVELGYYRLQRREYRRIRLKRQYELISLLGNLGWVDGAPLLHAHVTLGAEDFQTVGGHLFEATVLATAELILSPGSARLERSFDDEIGLKLWDLPRN